MLSRLSSVCYPRLFVLSHVLWRRRALAVHSRQLLSLWHAWVLTPRTHYRHSVRRRRQRMLGRQRPHCAGLHDWQHAHVLRLLRLRIVRDRRGRVATYQLHPRPCVGHDEAPVEDRLRFVPLGCPWLLFFYQHEYARHKQISARVTRAHAGRLDVKDCAYGTSCRASCVAFAPPPDRSPSPTLR